MDEATENNDGKMEVVKFLYQKFLDDGIAQEDMIVYNKDLSDVIKSH